MSENAEKCRCNWGFVGSNGVLLMRGATAWELSTIPKTCKRVSHTYEHIGGSGPNVAAVLASSASSSTALG